MGTWRCIGPENELAEGECLRFEFEADETSREGFAFRWDGAWKAYENRCRHIPLTLDYGDGRFFAEDGRTLLCSNHGARYEPETGVCIAGPCTGLSLRSLRIEVRQGEVWIEDPD